MRRTLVVTMAGALVASGAGVAIGATSIASSGHGDRQAAVRVAKQVLADAPVASGAKRVNKAPAGILRHPPSSPGEGGLVTRARYWVVPGSAVSVFEHLTAKAPAGFRSDGSGSVGDRSGVTMRFASDEVKTLPKDIVTADLMIAVAPLKDGKAGIGAYAEAAAQPPRPKAELAPASSTVSVSWTLSMWDHHPLSRTLTGTSASRLITSFNAMPVSTLGPLPCPANFGASQTATFTGGGHTWVATFSNCAVVSVTRDGKSQKPLLISNSFDSQLRHDLGMNGPKRASAEQVPAGVDTVKVTRTTSSGSASRTSHGSRARNLVNGFDVLDPVRSGVLTCAATGTTTTATFIGPHHTWVATEDPCELISVTRDGAAQATLADNGMWFQSLSEALK